MNNPTGKIPVWKVRDELTEEVFYFSSEEGAFLASIDIEKRTKVRTEIELIHE